MSLYVSARKYGPQVCDGYMILSLALPSILSSFCKEIWTLGVSWLQTSANFLETVFGQWVGQWVGHWTIFTSPAFSVEYGGAGNGGYGVTHLLRTFDPPPNVNLPGLGFGGSNILYTEPSPSGKNTKGSKLLLTFFERPPCLHPTERVVILRIKTPLISLAISGT